MYITWYEYYAVVLTIKLNWLIAETTNIKNVEEISTAVRMADRKLVYIEFVWD